MEIPDSLQLKMALFKNRGHVMMLEPEAFERDSWVAIYSGFGLAPKDYDRRADAIGAAELKQQLAQIKQTIAAAAGQPLSHSEFIARHCAAPESP